MAEKTYNEAEVAALLRRASRLRQAQDRTGSRVELTMAEIKVAAAEAGIDAHLVELAAAADVTSRTQSILGVPSVSKGELTVEQPFQRALWPQLVDVFEAATGKEGRTITQGTQRIWTTGLRTFTVDDLDAHTSVSYNGLVPAGLAWGILATILATGILATGVVAAVRGDGSIGLVVLAMVSVLLASGALLRALGKAQTERASERAAEALDQCAMLLHSPTPSTAPPLDGVDGEWDAAADEAGDEIVQNRRSRAHS